MRWGAVIVAAGHGTRLGRPKQFIELCGLPMVGWSIQTFAAMDDVREIVVATEPESIDAMRELVGQLAPNRPHRIVAGGATRQKSARAGLMALSAACDAAFVHDGARPLVTAHDVASGMREVRANRGALLAGPVIDTIKLVDPDSQTVRSTFDRRALWAAQTPQFGTLADLRNAHDAGDRDGVEVTDDASLLERIGVEVAVVPSTSENFKITLLEDVARAEVILNRRAANSAACHPELVEG